MPHERLSDYLQKVERAILKCVDAYVEKYTEEIITPERANLRIRVRFEKGYLLEINEAVLAQEGQLVFLDYRYHCQDKQNQLVFRYDNTPHFPGLDSYPHHKHLQNVVVPTGKPDIENVVKEVLVVATDRVQTSGNHSDT